MKCCPCRKNERAGDGRHAGERNPGAEAGGQKSATSQPEEEEQLEGQMDITDFPEFMPEPEENNVINIMDLVDEPDGVDCLDEEPAAGRQPERDLDSASSCPPGISSCIRQNWGTSKKTKKRGERNVPPAGNTGRRLMNPSRPNWFRGSRKT